MSKRKPEPWFGRVDQLPPSGTKRWHQNVKLSLDDKHMLKGTPVITGFCSDEGVRRNQGRVGAKEGPKAIRQALANLPCDETFVLFDNGDFITDRDLEIAQECLAEDIEKLLHTGAFPITLGGGHEVAWPSFLGAQRFLLKADPNANLGIINFDAHFDLRIPSMAPSSGTPFWQCHDFCEKNNKRFFYTVYGINPAANTAALFDTANVMGVDWVEDSELEAFYNNKEKMHAGLERFIAKVDYLYLTICMDVFNSAFAPGVSAPASMGITPTLGVNLLREILHQCELNNTQLLLCDVAEVNPRFDVDGRTAGLAGRLVWEVCRRIVKV